MVFQQDGQQVGVQFNFKNEEAQEAFVEEAAKVHAHVDFRDVGERLARETSARDWPFVMGAIVKASARAGQGSDVQRFLDEMLQGFLTAKLQEGLLAAAE